MDVTEHKFDSEVELAAVAVAWLEARGWDVYQEVSLGQSSPVCDIVAVKATDLWALSCKNSLSLKVVTQAHFWYEHYADFASVVVPAPKRPKSWNNSPDFRIQDQTIRILKQLGLGMLRCFKETVYEFRKPKDKVKVTDKDLFDFRLDRVVESMHHKRRRENLMRALRDEHKTYAKAGSAGGGHWTPFRGTVDKLVSYVEANPGCTMREALAKIEHHYASVNSACSSLLTYINRGIITRLQLVRRGRQFVLYTQEQWKVPNR